MIHLVAPRSEIGRALSRQLRAGAEPPGDIVINVCLQPPNTLLSDGHAWKRMPPARILGQTRKQLAAAQRADFLVHASYAFLRNVEQGGTPAEHMRPIVEAALEAEALVLASGRAACVVRVGYHYGPDSADLRAYRVAFRLGRPFWAGPKSRRQHFVHADDAAVALLAAATSRPQGRLVYATDTRPASFADFGDQFARLVGNPIPTHIPKVGKIFARAIIAAEHMEPLETGVKGQAMPQVPGFTPRYADYKAGLAAVVAEWDREK